MPKRRCRVSRPACGLPLDDRPSAMTSRHHPTNMNSSSATPTMKIQGWPFTGGNPKKPVVVLVHPEDGAGEHREGRDGADDRPRARIDEMIVVVDFAVRHLTFLKPFSVLRKIRAHVERLTAPFHNRPQKHQNDESDERQRERDIAHAGSCGRGPPLSSIASRPASETGAICVNPFAQSARRTGRRDRSAKSRTGGVQQARASRLSRATQPRSATGTTAEAQQRPRDKSVHRAR